MCQSNNVDICVSMTLFPFLFVYLTYFQLKFIPENFLDVDMKEDKKEEEVKKTRNLTTRAAWPYLGTISVQCSRKMYNNPLLSSLPRSWAQMLRLILQSVKLVYNMGFHMRKWSSLKLCYHEGAYSRYFKMLAQGWLAG